jgi:hypothetical protein
MNCPKCGSEVKSYLRRSRRLRCIRLLCPECHADSGWWGNVDPRKAHENAEWGLRNGSPDDMRELVQRMRGDAWRIRKAVLEWRDLYSEVYEVQETGDEVSDYLGEKYLEACEALYQIAQEMEG